MSYVPPMVHEDLNEVIREALRNEFGYEMDDRYVPVIKEIMDTVWPLLEISWDRGRSQGYMLGFRAGGDEPEYRENTWSTPPSGEVRTGQ